MLLQINNACIHTDTYTQDTANGETHCLAVILTVGQEKKLSNAESALQRTL